MSEPYPKWDNSMPPNQGYELVRSNESKRRTRRLIVILLLLLLLLGLIGYSTYYFILNRKLPLPAAQMAEEVKAPEYLYSISGPAGKDALTRPYGVAVGKNDWVYATDTKADVIKVYESAGKYLFSISKIDDGAEKALKVPAHLAIGPRDELYVSDRRLRAVYVFTAEGKYIRKIAPTKAKDDKLWGPLGIGFDEKGNTYVTDAGRDKSHQVIVFDPAGKEILRFGKTSPGKRMSDFPGDFYFPNGILTSKDGSIYVSDSNNRRVQIFDSAGKFQRLIQTSGIPRGVTMDPQGRLYVVDALSHSVDVFGEDNQRIVGFGESGVGPGQFRYANDIDLDSKGRIYVTDRENHQVQVWGWPVEPVLTDVLPKTTMGWLACLSPLLLLPLLLLLRRRIFVVAPEYMEAVIDAGLLQNMADMRRVRFVVPAEEWDAYSGRMVDGLDVGSVIQPEAYSETDARALMERLHIDRTEGVLLAMAERYKRLCTIDPRLAALAGALRVDVFDLSLLSGKGDGHKRAA